MRIFENGRSSWGSKVNFVDANDVFVGYDIEQSCCEDAGYFITDEITPYSYDHNRDGESPDIENYNFDKDFIVEVASPDLDNGGMVAFRLIADGEPDLYLHLYNSHNGYYAHGFEVKHSGETVHSGGL